MHIPVHTNFPADHMFMVLLRLAQLCVMSWLVSIDAVGYGCCSCGHVTLMQLCFLWFPTCCRSACDNHVEANMLFCSVCVMSWASVTILWWISREPMSQFCDEYPEPMSQCRDEYSESQCHNVVMGWQVEDLLREAMVLKEALDEAVSSSVLEKLLPKRYKQYQKGISQRS